MRFFHKAWWSRRNPSLDPSFSIPHCQCDSLSNENLHSNSDSNSNLNLVLPFEFSSLQKKSSACQSSGMRLHGYSPMQSERLGYSLSRLPSEMVGCSEKESDTVWNSRTQCGIPRYSVKFAAWILRWIEEAKEQWVTNTHVYSNSLIQYTGLVTIRVA